TRVSDEVLFSSRRRPTRSKRDWSSDVCSSDLRGRTPMTAAMVVLAVIGVRPRDGWYGLPEAFLVLAAIGIAVTATLGVFTRLLRSEERRVGEGCRGSKSSGEDQDTTRTDTATP